MDLEAAMLERHQGPIAGPLEGHLHLGRLAAIEEQVPQITHPSGRRPVQHLAPVMLHAVGRSLENLAGMMKNSITELQGMIGGEMSQSMQQLRQSAASGEGQMRATMDLAKEMGSGISRQQEMRKARGKMLFDEYKKKMGMVQPEATPQASSAPAERQRIAEK